MVLNYEADIEPIKNRDAFPDEGAKRYFYYWCGVNDKVSPVFISRDEWNKKRTEGRLLENDDNDNLIINVPEDLQMWEIFDIIRLIDQDTFKGSVRAKEHREELKKLVDVYRKTGIYLKTYAKEVNWSDEFEAEKLAVELSTDFYRFSRWAQFRKKRAVIYDQVPQVDINDNEIRDSIEKDFRQVEEDLFGQKFVQKRYDRLEKRLGREPTLKEIDAERSRIVKAFFQAMTRTDHAELDFDQPASLEKRAKQDLSWNQYADKYLGKNNTKLEEGEQKEEKELREDFSVEKPWQKFGPFFAFQQATYLGINRQFSQPRQELDRAIARRGKAKLIEALPEAEEPTHPRGLDLFKKLGFDFSRDKQRLVDKVGVEKHRQRLAELKRLGASKEMIAHKELEIVDVIQKEISKYEYEEWSSLPVDIKGSEEINCVGASLLSSALFEEIGINHLEAGIEAHSVMVIITSDGNAHYRDMRYPRYNVQLSDEQLGEGQLGLVQEFSENTQSNNLRLKVNPNWYRTIKFDQDFIEPYLELFHPSKGLDYGVIDNFLAFLEKDVNSNYESIDTLARVLESQVEIFPNDLNILSSLADVYFDLGDLDRAKLVLYRLNQVTKNSESKFILWGEIFYEEGKFELALESLRNSLIHNPKRREAWGMMIDCLEELGREGALKSTIEQAIIFTGNVVFKKRLIDFYLEKGLDSEALDIYEEIINDYPEDLNLWSDYYRVLFFEEPTQGNCRNVLNVLFNLGYQEDMEEIIKVARRENYDEDWPEDLAREFGVGV
ncbi:MAG: hypothetical protein OEX81_03945 [Candidatus Pacebacteria bacterium]|nr:hypothetical protein [Candidatus Paceibacterota bacterium]